jgi:hypothetical protein
MTSGHDGLHFGMSLQHSLFGPVHKPGFYKL